MVLLSSMLILGYDFLTQHSFFEIEAITVDGCKRLSEQNVVDQAQITHGANILSVNLSTARKRLLAHPTVSEAHVKRIFPSRIHLTVREHEPLAILDLGRKFVINAQGDIYREMESFHPMRLPLISGLEFSDISGPGQPFSLPYRAVMKVLRLGQVRKSIVPNRIIRRIHVDREIGLTIYARNQVKAIRLGYDNFDRKYSRLKNVLYHLKTKPGYSDLNSIDLVNLDRIVVNPSRREPPAGRNKEV